MDDILDQVTGLTANERKKALSWVASQPEQTVLTIFREAVKKSYQLKNEFPEITRDTRNYCAFILATRNSGWDTIKGKGYRIAEDKQIEDFSNLRQAKVIELSRKKGRPPVLKRKLLAHRGEIVEMMKEGHSYRTIADFLKKHRKIRTSPSNLHKLFKEAQAND
jgi:hypothetical protein